jgi:PAS domain S-box-containing protein
MPDLSSLASDAALVLGGGHYPAELVVIAYLVAAFSAYTAFHLIMRVRAATSTPIRLGWIALTVLAVGLAMGTLHLIARFGGMTPNRLRIDPSLLAAAIGILAQLLISLALLAALFARRAERAESLMHDAINSITAGFVVFDSEHRLVTCNEAYRKIYFESAHLMTPGARLEDIVRDGLERGRYPDVTGSKEQWLAERMRQHKSAQVTFEQQLSDGSWVLNTDHRMSNGGYVGLRMDISALKAAQAALHQNEQRFRDFAELTSDWFWEQDADLRFTMIGLGSPLKWEGDHSPVGRRRWELNDTTRAPDHWERHRRDVVNHRPFRDFRYDQVGPDGNLHHVSVSGVPMFDEAGVFTGYRGTGREITRQVQAEAELRAAKERAEQAETLLQDAVNSISEGFVIYDSDDRFVMCNEAYRRLYADSADLMVPGTSYRSIVRQWLARTGRADIPVEQWLARRLRQHREATGAIEQQMDDGRWILLTDRPMSNGGIAGLRIDITALKSAQAALRESEQRLDKAQEIAGIGSWEVDVPTGAAIWSRELYRLRGIAEGEQQTLNGLERTIHAEDWPRALAWLERLKQGSPQEAIEYRIHRPDGQVRIVSVEGQPVTDAAGVVTKLTGTVQDITERRKTERQLVQAQKMESVGQLTGGLAHDFNNILGAVIGHLDLAESDAAPDSPAAEHLHVALDAALRGAELVKRLLAFSRRQVLYPKPTDLRAVLANLLPLVEHTLGEHIRIATRFPDRLWTATADVAELEAAILNLIVNARDAMPNGGTLTIEAANSVVSTALATSSGELLPGDYAVISVADTGCGMPPEVLARVFEPFFTTKGPVAGSGLGLSMVFGTVQQLGGTVHLYSEVGQGTTVRLYLPRAELPQEPRRQPAAAAQPLPGGEERILLVEDNVQIRAVGTQILRGLGYRVTVAENADAALGHLENGEQFDLLFTDIVMPGQLDGITLARELRARDPVARILFTSGFSSPAVLQEQIFSLGGAELIAKPYRKSDLAMLVRGLLNRATETVV